MRFNATGSICGPTSLSRSLRIGEFGNPANAVPIRPPIDVPNQSTVSTFSRAMSVTMSETYCGDAVVLRIGKPVGQAAPDDIRAHHAILAAERLRDLVEVAPGARQAVHADAARADSPGRPTRCTRRDAGPPDSRTAHSVGAAQMLLKFADVASTIGADIGFSSEKSRYDCKHLIAAFRYPAQSLAEWTSRVCTRQKPVQKTKRAKPSASPAL